MRNFLLLLPFILVLGACSKEVVTKDAPVATPSTPQAESQGQVEGTINGGGGKGVLCRKGQKTTVETLDLYEAKVLYGLEIKELATNQDEAIEEFTTILTRHLWNPSTVPMDQYKKNFKDLYLNILLKNIKFISRDKKLKLVNDSFEPLVEKDCEMVQVAVYYDESILLVDESLWNQMSWTSRIGLLAHEILYLMDRQNGSKNSISTRKLVGQLFSSSGARPRGDGIPMEKNKVATCTVFDRNVDVGYLYAYDSSRTNLSSENEAGVELVFNYLKNSRFLFRTSAFFNRITLADLFGESTLYTDESPLYVESYQPKQTLHVQFLGQGKGKITILEEGSGAISNELRITCRKQVESSH